MNKMKSKLCKKLICFAAAAVMTVALAACGNDEKESGGSEGSGNGNSGEVSDQEPSGEDGQTELTPDRHHVEITIRDYGTISVELYREVAPVTVDNFLKLAGDGFYDGLTFHRIIEGFMMQGGDPEGTGYGGSDETIKGEFSSNGVQNDLAHTRGAISMARSSAPDSASSQFFIVHQDSPHLDGDYACFGYVTEGLDVVDAVCEETPVTDGNGSVAKENQPVIESIKVID